MSKAEQSTAPQDTGLDPVLRDSENPAAQNVMTLLGAKRLRTLLFNVLTPTADVRDLLTQTDLVQWSTDSGGPIAAGATLQQLFTAPADLVLVEAFVLLPNPTVANTLRVNINYLPPSLRQSGPRTTAIRIPLAFNGFDVAYGNTVLQVRVRANLGDSGRFFRAGTVFQVETHNAGAAATPVGAGPFASFVYSTLSAERS